MTEKRCPHASAKRFFENLASMFLPRGKIPALKEMEALKAIKTVNGRASRKNMHMTAPSLHIGNSPLTTTEVFVKFSPPVRLHTEIHGILRGMIGQVGNLLERGKLPPGLQKSIADLREEKIVYRQKIEPLKERHQALYPEADRETKWDVGVYADYEMLLEQIKKRADKNEEIEKFENEIKESEERTEKILSNMTGQFSQLEFFYLKGVDKRLPNDAKEYNTAEWLFWAREAAAGLMDTTHHPQAMRDKMTKVVNTAVDVVADFAKHMEESEILHQSPVFNVVERAAEKAQDAIALAVSWEQIEGTKEIKDFADIFQINSKSVHKQIRKRAEKRVAKRTVSRKTAKGVCPFSG